LTGTVAVCCQETAKYTETSISLANLDLPTGWKIVPKYGVGISYLRQLCAEQFEGEHLFFLDDDHVFPPDILFRLLAHKKDIVAAFYLRRHFPFQPACDPSVLKTPPGLHEVGYAGTSGMLIHRRVFDGMESPFFYSDSVTKTNEDVTFCQRAVGAGFKIFVDTATPMSHISPMFVTPNFQDGTWRPGITSYDGFGLALDYKENS
jgi:hypothetical protein